MPEPTDYARGEASLPGLEPPSPSASPLELAARRSLAALDELGLLDDRHAMSCQLILDLAHVVDAGRRGGKAAAVAMAAAQLREAFATLPAPEEGGDEDEWDELARELRDAAAAEREQRAAALRDAAQSDATD